MLKNILLVGCGGFAGAVSRFAMNQVVHRVLFHSFPMATLVVNVVGSMAVGFLAEYFRTHHWVSTVTLFAMVGYLGSFTTFSTFSLETVALFKRHGVQLAALNVAANLFLCLGGVVLGDGLGRLARG